MPRSHRATETDEIDGAADALLVTSRALVAISVRAVLNASIEITVAQHRVLVILSDHGALAVNQIADRLGVDQSNAGRHCQRLHRNGLVDRVRAESDRRRVEVVLTPAGRALLAEVSTARRGDIRAALTRLPPGEISAVVRSMSALNSALEGVDPG
ncbi:hypothetical protein GCM10009795_046610 [Nocardioides hankookensis]